MGIASLIYLGISAAYAAKQLSASGTGQRDSAAQALRRTFGASGTDQGDSNVQTRGRTLTPAPSDLQRALPPGTVSTTLGGGAVPRGTTLGGASPPDASLAASTAAAQAAAAAAAQRKKSLGGSAETVLTGTPGARTPTARTQPRTLMGGY